MRRSKRASDDVRGPKTISSHRRIMGNAAVHRPQNENRTLMYRPDERTLIIDQELERLKRESQTTIRILLDNVSNDPVLKEVLRVFGMPLAYDDQILYRILLQSKLLLDTKKLCRQLEKQNLVQELSTDFHSSTTMEYHKSNLIEHDMEDDDFHEGLYESKTERTPRDAYDLLISIFPDEHQQKFALSTADISEISTFCERASPIAIANSELVIRYAEDFRILWASRTVQNFFMFQRVNPSWSSGIKQFTKDDMFRFTSPEFRPEPKDLSGIGLSFPVITRIRINGADFEIHEIGGLSRRQRQQHIHSFGQAAIFMFATSLAQYDEPTIAGLSSVWMSHMDSQLVAAINEFRFFLDQNSAFRQKRPIVLLTHKDKFAAKMQYSDLAEYPSFSDFRGTPMQAIDFIVQKFRDYPHQDWTLVKVLPVSNQCSVSFFMEALRQSLLTDEETLQSLESE